MLNLMDHHTLNLLDFHKVRDLVASYAITSLGKELASQLQPLHDIELIHRHIAIVTEMTEALSASLLSLVNNSKSTQVEELLYFLNC